MLHRADVRFYGTDGSVRGAEFIHRLSAVASGGGVGVGTLDNGAGAADATGSAGTEATGVAEGPLTASAAPTSRA